jgi:hypothetical protein
MFIYWAPATSVFGFMVLVVDVVPLLGMTGVVLGIIGENNIACRHGG